MNLMLKQFEIENFRGFSTKRVFNLEAAHYNFNSAVICNSLVKNAIIYGKNGTGKTTLGVALFDIVSHLTDNRALPQKMLLPFCNLSSTSKEVTFRFIFKYKETELIYSYTKGPSQNLLREHLLLGKTEIVNWDYTPSGHHYVNKESIKDLQINLVDDKLSVIKYIARNTPTGSVPSISDLVDFVTHMLWFRNLDERIYAGMQPGEANIVKTIYEHNALEQLEQFLSGHGINYRLTFRDSNGEMYIAALFDNNKEVDLIKIASSGTLSLLLYFAWRITAFEKASLVFIDEFDAFLHFESSSAIVNDLIGFSNFQSIVTTHNVALLNNTMARPDSCFILGQHSISSFAKTTPRVIREAHNLEKMYVNGLFQES